MLVKGLGEPVVFFQTPYCVMNSLHMFKNNLSITKQAAFSGIQNLQLKILDFPDSHFVVYQMTLGSVIFCGYTVVDVVSIVGFVMEKQEGTAPDVHLTTAVHSVN